MGGVLWGVGCGVWMVDGIRDSLNPTVADRVEGCGVDIVLARGSDRSVS